LPFNRLLTLLFFFDGWTCRRETIADTAGRVSRTAQRGLARASWCPGRLTARASTT